jgi:hypothetical protein
MWKSRTHFGQILLEVVKIAEEADSKNGDNVEPVSHGDDGKDSRV